MSRPDIRWIQRLDNFKPAPAQPRRAAVLAGERKLTEREQPGLIQALDDLLRRYEMDLSLMSCRAHSALRAHIRRVSVVLYEKKAVPLEALSA